MDAETASLQKAINAEISSILDQRSSIDAQLDALNSINAIDFDQKHMDETVKAAGKRRDLIRRELSVRERIDSEWWPAERRAYNAAADDAQQRLDNLIAKLKAEFIRLGYIDGINPVTGMLSITPGMFISHPDVPSLRNQVLQYQALREERARAKQNAAEIEHLEKMLQEHKARLMQFGRLTLVPSNK